MPQKMNPSLFFTHSEQREIQRALKRIAVRKDAGLEQVRKKFEDDIHAAENVLSANNPSAAKKRILLSLRAKSEPVKTNFKKQFGEKCGVLREKIPGLTHIETHPDFEENFIILHFRVNGQNGWDLFLEKLQDHASDVDALLRFLRCEEFEVD